MFLAFVVCVALAAGSDAGVRHPSAKSAGCDIVGGIQAVVFVPQDSNTIWAHCELDHDDSPAAFGRASLYRSDDGAQTWNEVPVLPRSWHISAFGVSRSGQEVYVGGSGNSGGVVGLWQSLDGGMTWSRLAGWPKAVVPIGSRSSGPALAGAIAVEPSNPATVYAVVSNVVLRTRDAGRTWHRLSGRFPAGNEPVQLALHPTRPNVLYVGTSKGVYRSDDAGDHWASTSRRCSRDCLIRASPPQGSSPHLTIDPSRPRRLYAEVNGLYRSTDGGDRWRRILSVAWDVAVAKDGSIYAFTGSNITPFAPIRVARSADGGTTWRRTVVLKGHPSGASTLAFGPLAVDPAHPKVALAVVGADDKFGGAVCVRLLKTKDGGRRWQPAERGLIAPRDRCPLR